MKNSYQFHLTLFLSFVLFALPYSTKAQRCIDQTITISNGELEGTTTRASSLIFENMTVPSEAHIVAGNNITLSPDFHVLPGATFSAKVEPSLCSPFVTAPIHQSTLANGCVEGTSIFYWTFDFDFSAVPYATQHQSRVKRPDGTISTNYFHEGGTQTGSFLSIFIDGFIPESELNNWTVQVRSQVDGVWTDWYGHSPNTSETVFHVAPPKTCLPLITSPVAGATLDNGCDGTIDTMYWHFEWMEVDDATEYQLIIEHPSVGVTTFNKIVTTNSWTFKKVDRISNYFTDWTAKVRAKVNGEWTDYYGGTVEEEVLLFNVEVKNTDCAPIVLTPKSGAVFDNGCTVDNGEIYQINWQFENKELDNATHYEIKVKDPEGTTFFNFQSTGYRPIWEYSFNPEILSSTTLTDWSVQFRAQINGIWAPWYGHSIHVAETFFDLEPLDTDCPSLVEKEGKSRNTKQLPSSNLDNSIDFRVYPNPFRAESTIVYHLKEDAAVQLGIYSLAGQAIAILVNQKQQIAGTYTIPFAVNQQIGAGMYLARLQVGEVVTHKKIVLLD